MTNHQPCDEKQLTLYHYNELEPETRQQVEKHLESCTNCRVTLEQIEACLTAIPKVEQTIDSASRLRFTEQVMVRTGSRSKIGKPVWGGALAAAGALALVLTLMPNFQQQPVEMLNPALTELELLEQLELLQNFDILQDLELLGELEDLG